MDELKILDVHGDAVVLLPDFVVERLGLRGASEVEYVWEGEGVRLLPAPPEPDVSAVTKLKPRES